MKQYFYIFAALILLPGYLSGALHAQTFVYLGNTSIGEQDSIRISVNLDNELPVAGLQFKITDDSAVVVIDSVKAAGRCTSFTAMTHNNQVLLFHEMGSSIASGDGPIAELLLHVERQLTGTDTVRFSSDVVLADTTARAVTEVESRNGVLVFDPVTGVLGPVDRVPGRFALYQNYPNPFNDQTTIRFDVAESGHVRIDLFNIHGEKVTTLVNHAYIRGNYQIKIDMQNRSSGIYIYRLTAGSIEFSRKFLLLK